MMEFYVFELPLGFAVGVLVAVTLVAFLWDYK